eukprot:gene1680-449_t
MCYQSRDADCISVYEIIRIPKLTCLKRPKGYCSALGHYLYGYCRCLHPKNVLSLFHLKRAYAWFKFFTFWVSPIISSILFIIAINAFVSFIGVATDLVTVAKSWRSRPIMDIRTTTGNCLKSEEYFETAAWLYPGNYEGCRCPQAVDIPFVSCSTIGSPGGCTTVKEKNGFRFNKWQKRKICIIRGGDAVETRSPPNADDSCPQYHISCGPICMKNVTKCPITSFQYVTSTTAGAINLGNIYVLPKRNESISALPVNDIIIHEEVPCVGGVCRNKRTQLLKNGICDKVCKDDTRWTKLANQNETEIFDELGISKGLATGSVKYYLSYRTEILWERAGGKIPTLADQKYILSKSDTFELIPYFYEFSFYITIVDFVILTAVVPILALCTDRLRYNFFPERMHISRVDTLNQLGLFADAFAVGIKGLRLAPVGFSFWVSVGFWKFFEDLLPATTDPITKATIREIAGKYIAFGLIINAIALTMAVINFIAALLFLVHAFYSDIHFVLLNYDEISSDYDEVKSFSGLVLVIWLNYKYKIYRLIFDNSKLSVLPFFECMYGKKYAKRDASDVRDIDDNDYFYDQKL